MVFALSLSVNSDAIPASGTLPISARVTAANEAQPLSLTAIGNEILGSGAGAGWGSGSGRFNVSVPDTTHDVDLVITEGSFSQGFDLWTLTRTAPAPVVLYRDATMPTLAATSTTNGALALSNPADGFSDTAEVSVQSATLGEFPPSGAGAPPSSPDQAVLSVVLDAEYPFDQNDLSGSGHYLGARSPLPGSLLTFIPAGGTAITAIMSNAGDNAGKGNHDDGLFDATYSFVVPADVTTGTLSVGGGSFSGTEFTLLHGRTGEHHPRHRFAAHFGARISRRIGGSSSAHAAVGWGTAAPDGLGHRYGDGRIGGRKLSDLAGRAGAVVTRRRSRGPRAPPSPSCSDAGDAHRNRDKVVSNFFFCHH